MQQNYVQMSQRWNYDEMSQGWNYVHVSQRRVGFTRDASCGVLGQSLVFVGLDIQILLVSVEPSSEAV